MNSASEVASLSGREILRSSYIVTKNESANQTSVMGAADQIISSDESDDNNKPESRQPSAETVITDSKNKIENDPNAPRKPVSAYALFFGDTQAAIKSQNPSASFAEISTIVASMWDVLAHEHKEVYRKKSEDARKEYRRLKTIYRANLLVRNEQQQNFSANSTGPCIEKTSSEQQIASAEGTNQPTLVIQPSGVSSLQDSSVAADNKIHGVKSPSNTASYNIAQQACIRNGCQNSAIVSPDWEDEYCSNECVVSHCAEIFLRWVQDNSAAESLVATTS